MNTEEKIPIKEPGSNGPGKIILGLFFLLIIASGAATYYRIFIKHAYLISAQTDCDPLSESCYVWQCDPVVDGEGVCTGDPEQDTWYYKNIKRSATNIPNCDPNDENCVALTCPEGEKNCEITNCNPEKEECTTPEKYLEEHPEALGEESACAEGDEECLKNEESSNCEEGDETCAEEPTDTSEGADAAADIKAPDTTAPEDIQSVQ